MKKGTEDVVYNIEDLERPARGETGELVCGNHQVEGIFGLAAINIRTGQIYKFTAERVKRLLAQAKAA